MNYCLDISRQVETLMQASPLMLTSTEPLHTVASLFGTLVAREGRLEKLPYTHQCLDISSQVQVWCRKVS